MLGNRKRGEDVKHANLCGKEKKGRPKKRWLDISRDDMIEYKMTEGMTQNKSVWHLNTKAGALLHGGDMYYVGLGVKVSMKMQTFKNKQT